MAPRIENWEPWAILSYFVAMGVLFPAAALPSEETSSRLLIALLTFIFLASWLLWPLSVLSRVNSGPILQKIKPLVWVVVILAILAAGTLIAANFLQSTWSFDGIALALYLVAFVMMAFAFAQLAKGQRLMTFIFSLVSLYFIPLGAFYLRNMANRTARLPT